MGIILSISAERKVEQEENRSDENNPLSILSETY
jgi:hypothetical protein